MYRNKKNFNNELLFINIDYKLDIFKRVFESINKNDINLLINI